MTVKPYIHPPLAPGKSGVRRRTARRSLAGLLLAAVIGPAAAVTLPASGAMAMTCLNYEGYIVYNPLTDEHVQEYRCTSWMQEPGVNPPKDGGTEPDGGYDGGSGGGYDGGDPKATCEDANEAVDRELAKLATAITAASLAWNEYQTANGNNTAAQTALDVATTASDAAQQTAWNLTDHVDNLRSSATPLVRQWMENPNGVVEVERNGRTIYTSLPPLSFLETNQLGAIILAAGSAETARNNYDHLKAVTDAASLAASAAQTSAEVAKAKSTEMDAKLRKQSDAVTAARAAAATSCP